MPVVVFFVFVAVVGLCMVALGYCLSSAQERTTSRRCRMLYERHRRRRIRRQRVQCRFEG